MSEPYTNYKNRALTTLANIEIQKKIIKKQLHILMKQKNILIDIFVEMHTQKMNYIWLNYFLNVI